MQELILGIAAPRIRVINGTPYAHGGDVCVALDYKSAAAKTIRTHVDPEDVYEMVWLTEAGLYQLTFRSTKEEAKQWTAEVARKMARNEVSAPTILDYAREVVALSEVVDTQKQRLLITEKSHEFVQDIAHNTYTVTDSLRKHGVKRTDAFKFLVSLGWVGNRPYRFEGKNRNKWYSTKAGAGFVVDVPAESPNNPWKGYQVMLTTKGLQFLEDYFRDADDDLL